MTAITGAQALVRCLQQAGVDTIFAVPGVQLDWIFHALEVEGSPIRVIVPRHEQATTYMADGYSRTSGKIGVALVVPGPGVLNAMAGLSTAYASHSRVLLLAGQIHSAAVGRDLGLLHEIRHQDQVLGSCTKKTFSVAKADDIAVTTLDALAEIDRGRKGPVAIQLPHDLLAARVADVATAAPKDGANVSPAAMSPDRAAVAAAAQMLRSARFPVIFAGGGVAVAGAARELRALAEQLQAPVVMSENARGLLPDDHPLALSMLGGQSAFKEADAVLVAGSRFVDLVTGQPIWQGGGIRYIGLNIDAPALGAPRDFAVSLQADAAAGLAAIAGALGAQPPAPQRMERVAAIQQASRERIASLGELASYVSALRAGIPADATLVNELTQVGYLCRVGYPLHAPGTLITPGYQGTLGYAFPTGLGAALGSHRRAYALSGDGGFGWNLQELATAARYGIALTLVLFNDQRFSNVHALQKAQFGFSREVNLHNPDFRQLAQAFGVAYARADSPQALAEELKKGEGRSGPLLIEVPVGDMANPWPLLRLQPPPAPATQRQGDKQ